MEKKISTSGVVCKRVSDIVIFAFDKCEFSETRICQMRVMLILDEKKKERLYFPRVKLAFLKCEFSETRIWKMRVSLITKRQSEQTNN